MKSFAQTILAYSRELSFVLRKSADWPTRVVLLKNTILFHLRNALGRKSRCDLHFSARLRFGSSQAVEINMRRYSGDLFVLFEVLLHRCYYLPDTLLPPEEVRVILDCGANIGITALYFAWRYPNARIFCIEPDDRNFQMLKRNTGGVERIFAIHGALVGCPRKIAHLTMDRPAWGNFVTSAETGIDVPAFTVEQILDENRLSQVDLLKIDIEGAEKEVFANCEFLPRVRRIIIELHNNYGFDDFSKDVARWRFRAVAPEDAASVKMITAIPVEI
jgi:FkbM family methyltransferase